MLTFLLLIAAAPPSTLPPYAASIRCAGLAEARAARDGIRPGLPAFETAVFWGMAASEAARKDGTTGAQFTQDQQRATEAAMAELAAGDRKADGEYRRCLARVPPLKPVRKGKGR